MGQEKIIVSATGEYESRDLSPIQAKEMAIQNAKINALKNAGITEKIHSSSVLYTSQTGLNLTKLFSEISSNEIKGEIVVNDVKIIDQSFINNGNMVIKVEILATVYKYHKNKDPAFTFEMNGIQDKYFTDEDLKFTFTPRKDCYLKIFTLTDSTASLLYPCQNKNSPYLNEDEGRLFKANETITFPMKFGISYIGELPYSKSSEINHFLFVILKNEFPIKNISSLNDILNWIYSIPPDIRLIEYKEVLIKRRS